MSQQQLTAKVTIQRGLVDTTVKVAAGIKAVTTYSAVSPHQQCRQTNDLRVGIRVIQGTGKRGFSESTMAYA